MKISGSAHADDFVINVFHQNGIFYACWDLSIDRPEYCSNVG